jgi:hypothetical protein
MLRSVDLFRIGMRNFGILVFKKYVTVCLLSVHEFSLDKDLKEGWKESLDRGSNRKVD